MARPAPQPVMAPPAAAPRYGLLASSPPVKDQGDRWLGGITYRPEGCIDYADLWDFCDYRTAVTPVTEPDAITWWPYNISLTTRCSTFSGTEGVVERVTRLMNQQTETLIGHELWSGDLASSDPDNPNTWLASPDAEELSSGPVGYVMALSCLEQYLAENNGGRQGMIHATAQVVTIWESFRLLRREGNRILTFKDTVIVPSPGYLGTDPTGAIADGNVWAYATDMVRIWLTEPQVPDLQNMMDRMDNTVDATAHRTALVEWERCRHAGIQIAVSICGSGS